METIIVQATDTKTPLPKLATEGPLSEKDEQGLAVERARGLQEEALKQWRRLKAKVARTFKKMEG
jgi:hypothetical protein